MFDTELAILSRVMRKRMLVDKLDVAWSLVVASKGQIVCMAFSASAGSTKIRDWLRDRDS